MAAAKKKRFSLRFSKRILIAAGAFFMVLGVSGAAAFWFGASDLFEDKVSTNYGPECELADVAEFERDGQFWVRLYARMTENNGELRLKTAIRLAKATVEQKGADLVLVVIVDTNGPEDRALMRGRAVGTRVVHAPNPMKIAAVSRPYTASYAKGGASPDGEFFGETIEPTLAEIDTIALAMTEPYGCKIPTEEAEPKAASAHGEAPAADHGGGHEAKSAGHH